MSAPVFSLNYDAIRAALVHAAMAGCGLDQNHVIESEPEVPDAPRPTMPYLTLKIITPALRYGEDQVEQLGPAPLSTKTLFCHGGPRGMVVSFQAYGHSHEEAYTLLALWQAALCTQAVRDIISGAGVACGMVGNVTDISTKLFTGYEGRASMDVRFMLASNLTVAEDTVGQVTATGSVTPTGSADITATVKGL